jgi:hypothetical protein
MTFFYANTRGLRERTESRRSTTTEKDCISDEAAGLTKLMKKTQSKGLGGEAESASIDSPIYAYGSHMRMGDIHSATLSDRR